MGGRDHACETCGRGGLNDPDGRCVCGPLGVPPAGDFHCGRCGHLLDGGTDEPVSTRDLRKLATAVVEAWTQWIDTRSDEWMNHPDDPEEDALDNAVGDLGRVATPERYG